MFWWADKSTHLAVKVSGVVAIIQPKYDLIRISGTNLWTKWGLTVDGRTKNNEAQASGSTWKQATCDLWKQFHCKEGLLLRSLTFPSFNVETQKLTWFINRTITFPNQHLLKSSFVGFIIYLSIWLKRSFVYFTASLNFMLFLNVCSSVFNALVSFFRVTLAPWRRCKVLYSFKNSYRRKSLMPTLFLNY